MIEFRSAPFPSGTARLSLSAGADLGDALAQFGQVDDCIGCATTVAAPGWTSDLAIARVRSILSPLATPGPVVRPSPAATGLLRRGSWVEVNIDAGAQRLRTVKMPRALIDGQRLLAVNDLRGDATRRPTVALGLWSLFAHPVVRAGARVAGARDGLIAEIALAVHPDRYVVIERDHPNGLTLVCASPDPIATDLIVLALRQARAHHRGAGPWEDALVQAATELDLGARTSEQIDIDAFVSPALSSQQQEAAGALLGTAAELIGVRRAA